MSDRLDRRISIAPMMDWTDRHCRMLHRMLSSHALLYSEMIHANAILHGDTHRHLFFKNAEQPVALQLGGIDAKALAQAAKRGEEFGYVEINLNCGCPSDRVQQGQFGACLMAEPARVAEAVAEMQAAVKIPVTVKSRIGIDAQDSYEFLCAFIETVHQQGGCEVFVIHARKAWLSGLSPKENREVPPLDWPRVQQIKQDYPHLTIVTNGGFTTLPQIMDQMSAVDGVMIGRKAYHDPFFLTEIEKAVFNTANLPTRLHVAQQLLAYMQEEQTQATPLKHITRHALGLFYAQPRAKEWKHALMAVAKENDVAALKAFLLKSEA